MAKYSHYFSRLRFHQVKQRIQAHRVIVDYVDAEGAEPVRRIESGFPHRPVTGKKQRRQLICLAVVETLLIVVGDLMSLVILASPVVVGAALLITLGRDRLGRRSCA